MPEQSFAKHTRLVPLYHFVLFALVLAILVGSIRYLFKVMDEPGQLYPASLLAAISVALFLFFVFTRTFPLKAQDRAIRAEENLRHFALTGKLLDPRLKMKQIIGLRFAPDAEFPALAKKAADGAMEQKAIKQAIVNWKADNDRM